MFPEQKWRLILYAHLLNVVLADNLIFSQVLFRHGARAPSAGLSDPGLASWFPRGMGELTDRGYENSNRVGEFLADRYVKSGFLNKNMRPREMYWRSVNINRCLATAATVGAAMFADAHKHLHPPITTEQTDETLLNYDMATCTREHEIYKEMCPDYIAGSYKTWPDFEEFVADCLNITKDPIFQKIPFSKIESHLNEYKNGIPLPELLEINKEKVLQFYTETLHKTTGVGVHKNLDLMRIKFGDLVRTMQQNLENAWQCHLDGGRCVKFKAYSSQDWIILGVLEAFGVLNVTTVNRMPEYNSMIIIELWNDAKNLPYIKFLYKKDEIDTELLDVTENLRNCSSEKCKLADFLACCQPYWDTNKATCKSSNSLKKRSILMAKKPKFFGPE